MPRNGSGVYSLPPGSTFSPNTLADPSEVNAINQDIAADLNTPRPIVAGGTGSASKNFEDIVVFATKSGNYSAVQTDNNAVHRFTATATVSLSPAGSLGSGWHYTVLADGGSITIDPNGSETINGATTLVVPNGTSATIACDGSNFFAVFKPSLWLPIGSGKYSVSGVASVNITSLAAFSLIRIHGTVIPSAPVGVYLRTSTDNGSTYASGASDYLFQMLVANSSSVTANEGMSSALAITNSGVVAAQFTATIGNFNQNGNALCTSTVFANLTGGQVSSEANGAQRNNSVARNALQIICASGTAFSGTFNIEGILG